MLVGREGQTSLWPRRTAGRGELDRPGPRREKMGKAERGKNESILRCKEVLAIDQTHIFNFTSSTRLERDNASSPKNRHYAVDSSDCETKGDKGGSFTYTTVQKHCTKGASVLLCCVVADEREREESELTFRRFDEVVGQVTATLLVSFVVHFRLQACYWSLKNNLPHLLCSYGR